MKSWTKLRRQGAGSERLIKGVKKQRSKARRQVPIGEEGVFEKKTGERNL